MGFRKNKKFLNLLVAITVAVPIVTINSVKASEVETKRLGGKDRYETASKVCDYGWKATTDNAVLVNGQNFPDAITSAPLAKKFNAPILLTNKNILNPYTAMQLSRLGVKNVYIIGGKGVVSQNVEDGLKAKGIKVTRLGGKDRYDTALQVAKKIGKCKQIAVINGSEFYDAISISSIAALKEMPIIPVGRNSIPSSINKFLQSNKKIEQIYVIGGESEINNSVFKSIPNSVRIGSGDIYKRNIDIIKAFQNELNLSLIYAGSPRDFADVLTASSLAGKTASPIVFVNRPMNIYTKKFMESSMVNNINILGGTASVDYATEQSLKYLPLQITDTENIKKEIWQKDKFTPPNSIVVTASDGSRREAKIKWNLTRIDTTKPGIYNFIGDIEGYDKKVNLTLIVKPVPEKIDDIVASADSRDRYTLPETVSAKMTDGSTSNLKVTWDYGSQQKGKSGTYVFYGTVDNYNNKVKLTLNVNQKSDNMAIRFINNIKVVVNKKSEFIEPKYITATMEDNSTKQVKVTWSNEKKYLNFDGVYTYDGKVMGYSKKVKLMLIVKDENGVDPNDPKYPDKPLDTDKPEGTSEVIKDLGELTPIVQGDPYPTSVFDSKTKKELKVTWRRVTNIDTTFIDAEYVDDCRVAKITLEGVAGGGKSENKVRATISVIPKIISITTKDNKSLLPRPVVININEEGIYDMSKASEELRAVILNPNGKAGAEEEKIAKKVKVLLWDPPFIDIRDSRSYYVKAKVKSYDSDLKVTLKVRK